MIGLEIHNFNYVELISKRIHELLAEISPKYLFLFSRVIFDMLLPNSKEDLSLLL